MDIDQAHAYFREMGCSHFHMSREYPDKYNEFRALAIPKDIEDLWTREKIEQYLEQILDSSTDPADLWRIHSNLTDLAKIIRKIDVVKQIFDATQILAPLVTANTQILIAETIVGRGPDSNPGGLISLAYDLKDSRLSLSFANLVPTFCNAATGPAGGRTIEERKSAALTRLLNLSKRLMLEI